MLKSLMAKGKTSVFLLLATEEFSTLLHIPIKHHWLGGLSSGISGNSSNHLHLRINMYWQWNPGLTEVSGITFIGFNEARISHQESGAQNTKCYPLPTYDLCTLKSKRFKRKRVQYWGVHLSRFNYFCKYSLQSTYGPLCSIIINY